VLDWLSDLGLVGLFLGNFLAATVIPFSSDALYIAILAATKRPLACFLVGTAGNWLGSMVTFGMGWLGRWEWIEKWFKVKRETLEKQKQKIDRFGVWLALIAWVPVIGDVVVIALGFYKTHPLWTSILLLIGKAGRFLVWNLLVGGVQGLIS
jgi:membrane protein YqaA with SNARE-associated domain